MRPLRAEVWCACALTLCSAQSGDDELSPQEYLGAAASAKVVASVSTYPHEVIRTRMRERGAQELYKTAIGCVRKCGPHCPCVSQSYEPAPCHALLLSPADAVLMHGVRYLQSVGRGGCSGSLCGNAYAPHACGKTLCLPPEAVLFTP